MNIQRPSTIDVTKSNPRDCLYLKGDVNTEGSIRFHKEDIGNSHLEKLESGVWQDTSFSISPDVDISSTGDITTYNSSSHNVITLNSGVSGNNDVGDIDFQTNGVTIGRMTGQITDAGNDYGLVEFATKDEDGTTVRLKLEADANVITGDTNMNGNLEFDSAVGYYTLAFNSDVSGSAELGRLSWETEHIEGAYINSKVTDAANDYAKLLFFTKDSDGLTQRLQIKKDATEIAGTTTVYGQLNVTTTTGAIGLPNMTTTQRNALSPSAGDTIFNTTTSKMECYDGSTWQAAW
jgi:hypothetical protein